MEQENTKDRRSTPLAVRFTVAERERVTRAAQDAGVTLSDLMRSAVLGQPLPLSRPRRASRPQVADADKLALLLSAVGRIGNNTNQLARAANAGGWPEAEALRESVDDIRWMRSTLMLALGVREEPQPVQGPRR